MTKSVEQRRDRLRRLVAREGAGAMLVTNFTNVTYLTGFTGDDSYLLVHRGGAVLVSDPRYTQQLGEECPGLELEIRAPGTPMPRAVARVAGRLGCRTLAVEADSMSLALHERLQESLKGTTLAARRGLVERLREVKDRDEIREIRAAVETAERVFRVVRASLRWDETEREVVAELEHQARRFGGRGCSFPPIVAAGPRAALPHATPTDAPLGDSPFVLIDWGVRGRLYVSDLTRVLVRAKIPPKLQRIYEVVLRAQQQAIGQIRPGAVMADVDGAARRVITEAGFGKRFGHGLGHGIGLEVHEAPRLGAGEQRPLKAGMVVTVEPGVYLPGWGGVRIEDDVLVTPDGAEVLSGISRELSECVVP